MYTPSCNVANGVNALIGIQAVGFSLLNSYEVIISVKPKPMYRH